jgi:hypothetical protein
MMAENKALSIITLDATQAIEQARQLHAVVSQMRSEMLKIGIDYGVIPGTNKPTLLKPGAEKLCWALGYSPEFEAIDMIQDFDKPLFHYRYRCVLRHIQTGKVVATGIGSCNSMESKYGFRWLPEHEVPPHLDKSSLLSRIDTIEEFDFAIRGAKTSGKYGKPAEYWQKFKDAIASGTASKTQRETKRGMSDVWGIPSITYRVPNEDIFSIVNTLDKMAQKRALIAATLIGANASEFFTQDVEDMPDFRQSTNASVIEGEIVEETKKPQPHPRDAQKKDGAASNEYELTNRRKKVIAAFKDELDPTEIVNMVNDLGVDWNTTKSDSIITVLKDHLTTDNELRPTGTEGANSTASLDDIPF